MGELRIEALGKRHERKAFGCGSPALDRYLQQQARQDEEKHVAGPFVLIESPAAVVLGYYTLSAATITVDQIAPDLAQRLPRCPELQVTQIGRLAVDTASKGRGFGELLLMDALRSLNHAAEIAAMAVVVQAKDDAAAAYYRRYDFTPFQADTRRLYLPMKMVAQLFG